MACYKSLSSKEHLFSLNPRLKLWVLAASGLHQKQKTKQGRMPRKGVAWALMQTGKALVFSYPPLSPRGEQDPVIPMAQPGLSFSWKDVQINGKGAPHLLTTLLTKPPSLNLQSMKQTENSSTFSVCLFFVWCFLLLFCFVLVETEGITKHYTCTRLT